MHSGIGYIIKMGILFLLPFLILLLFKRPVNRHFRRRKKSIRIVDLVVPYFIVGIHIFSRAYSGHTWLPYFLLLIFSLGIILTLVFVFKLNKLEYGHFFRVWWRFIFLCSIILFVATGTLFFISLI